MALGTSDVYEMMMRCGRNRDRYKMLRPYQHDRTDLRKHDDFSEKELREHPVCG